MGGRHDSALGVLRLMEDNRKITSVWSCESASDSTTNSSNSSNNSSSSGNVLLVGPIVGLPYVSSLPSSSHTSHPSDSLDPSQTPHPPISPEDLDIPDFFVPILIEVSTSATIVMEVTSWLGGAAQLFFFQAMGRTPLVCDIGPLKGGSRYHVCIPKYCVHDSSDSGED